MVRKCKFNISAIDIKKATYGLGIYDSGRLLPNGRRNPMMDQGSEQYNKRAAKKEGTNKAEIFCIIDSLVSHAGWVTLGDIGIMDFENLLRIIYNFPQFPATIRGK